MLAVRPPEYFPRIAYYALADAADCLVLADTMQYSRQSFQNRARLRTPDGTQWISIPLKGGQHGRSARDVVIRRELRDWKRRHLRSIEFNYRSAPYYEFYEDRLREVFRVESDTLVEYTIRSVQVLAGLLGVETQLVRASELPGSPSTVSSILEALDADRIVIPPEALQADRAVTPDIRVLDRGVRAYRQNFHGFVPDVSALDLALNLGPDAVEIVRDYRLSRAPDCGPSK